MPKRTNEHRVETESTSILRDLTVNEAIFRELSERDYGIDGVLEFFNSDGSLIGNDVLLQIKGSRTVNIRNGFVKTPSIKTETVKYWEKKKQSVFILIVDVSKGVIYFADAKLLARINAEKVNAQKTIIFSMHESLVINSRDLTIFRKEIFLAEKFDQSKIELSRLIFDFKKIYKSLICNSGRNCFMVIDQDDPRIDMLNDVSRSIKLCWYFFGIHAEVHDFNHFMRKSHAAWNFEYVEMHITETADHLREQFHLLMISIILTKNIYSIFWKNNNDKIIKILNNRNDCNLMREISKGDIGIDNVGRLNEDFG